MSELFLVGPGQPLRLLRNLLEPLVGETHQPKFLLIETSHQRTAWFASF